MTVSESNQEGSQPIQPEGSVEHKAMELSKEGGDLLEAFDQGKAAEYNTYRQAVSDTQVLASTAEGSKLDVSSTGLGSETVVSPEAQAQATRLLEHLRLETEASLKVQLENQLNDTISYFTMAAQPFDTTVISQGDYRRQAIVSIKLHKGEDVSVVLPRYMAGVLVDRQNGGNGEKPNLHFQEQHLELIKENVKALFTTLRGSAGIDIESSTVELAFPFFNSDARAMLPTSGVDLTLGVQHDLFKDINDSNAADITEVHFLFNDAMVNALVPQVTAATPEESQLRPSEPTPTHSTVEQQGSSSRWEELLPSKAEFSAKVADVLSGFLKTKIQAEVSMAGRIDASAAEKLGRPEKIDQQFLLIGRTTEENPIAGYQLMVDRPLAEQIVNVMIGEDVDAPIPSFDELYRSVLAEVLTQVVKGAVSPDTFAQHWDDSLSDDVLDGSSPDTRHRLLRVGTRITVTVDGKDNGISGSFELLLPDFPGQRSTAPEMSNPHTVSEYQSTQPPRAQNPDLTPSDSDQERGVRPWAEPSEDDRVGWTIQSAMELFRENVPFDPALFDEEMAKGFQDIDPSLTPPTFAELQVFQQLCTHPLFEMANSLLDPKGLVDPWEANHAADTLRKIRSYAAEFARLPEPLRLMGKEELIEFLQSLYPDTIKELQAVDFQLRYIKESDDPERFAELLIEQQELKADLNHMKNYSYRLGFQDVESLMSHQRADNA